MAYHQRNGWQSCQACCRAVVKGMDMTHPTDAELEAMAARLYSDDDAEPVHPLFYDAAAMLRACKGRVHVKPLDLSLSQGHHHPDIKADGTSYLVKVNGGWFFGPFSMQWYGLNFSRWGASGCQFDAPGTNASRWEAVIEVDPEALYYNCAR